MSTASRRALLTTLMVGASILPMQAAPGQVVAGPVAAAPGPVADSPKVVATTLLKTPATWNGAPIAYPWAERPEVQTVRVEIAVGAATAWHMHPINNIAYILEGSLRLELEDGTTRIFKAGEAFAEVVNTWHRGVNVGNGPVKILVVYMGETGKPLSISKGESGH